MAILSKMQLLDLPAELVNAIVEQVVRVVGLERALKLRYVNSLLALAECPDHLLLYIDPLIRVQKFSINKF